MNIYPNSLSWRDVLITTFQRRGVPLIELHEAPWAVLGYEPDLITEDRTWGIGASTTKREFVAPLFRWKFEDGRKFQGRPEVRVKIKTWRSLLCGGQKTSLDEVAMINGLFKMIERSFSQGEDPQ